MKRIKTLYKILLATLAVQITLLCSLTLVAAPTVLALTPQQSVCTGAGLTGSGCTDPTAGGPTLKGTIATVISLLSWVVGIAAVIMIIISGFRYITSGGDSAKVTSAKDGLIYAIVGLVIAALAQFIVQFVLRRVIVTH